MAAPAFVSVEAVRDYTNLLASGTDSRYTDKTIGSNIRAASEFLQRWTHRQFENQTATTKVFTTHGRQAIAIPGLRTATSVTRAGATLEADSSFWLIPDVQQTGIYTAVQFGAFGTRSGGPWWLSSPEWFDRNYDHPRFAGSSMTSLPNDLSITGDWGYIAANYPETLLHTTKVLAAFFTKRPDALLSGVIATPEGGTFDLSFLPIEVQKFVEEWKLTDAVVAV